jgi:hypothetical protein
MKVRVDLSPEPHSVYEAQLTRLEWMLECGDRRGAQKGALRLLAKVEESRNAYNYAWAKADIETVKDIVDRLVDLYGRAEPVRTTSWERVLKDEP